MKRWLQREWHLKLCRNKLCHCSSGLRRYTVDSSGSCRFVDAFTGYRPELDKTGIDYQALVAGKGTIVMLMGIDRLVSITSKLLANGAMSIYL